MQHKCRANEADGTTCGALHGPREPKLQMEVSQIIMKWFDKHLRPDRARITTQ